jgi:hypothetical protein
MNERSQEKAAMHYDGLWLNGASLSRLSCTLHTASRYISTELFVQQRLDESLLALEAFANPPFFLLSLVYTG